MAENHAIDTTAGDDIPPTRTNALPREARSVPLAWHLVTTLLSEWSLPELADDAQLVLGELVANSVEHAQGASVRITVTRMGPARVRVAVADRDRTRPRLVTASPDDEGGRGLFLVDALSERWGVDVFRRGKRVWADLGAPS
ncbi:ATP-binding protein [Streptomyces sp. NPDC021020]|uniref:ATP-binding protein n=1 Tax=Streptomyces sp. NPDC021020 TaxID=3365109 RepID=UPI003799BE61